MTMQNLVAEDPCTAAVPRQLRIVIKVGTSSLIRPEQHTLNLSIMARICDTVHALHREGHKVVLVTSGAVGVGCQRLGIDKPVQTAKKRALAAVGQVYLMRQYEDLFASLGLPAAQVLLTLDNLANPDQYQKTSNMFAELLEYRAVPVVNENDSVAERWFGGDNGRDTLSAQASSL